MNTDYQQPPRYYESLETDGLVEEEARAILNSPHAKTSFMMSLALSFCQPSSPRPVSRPYLPSKGTLIF